MGIDKAVQAATNHSFSLNNHASANRNYGWKRLGRSSAGTLSQVLRWLRFGQRSTMESAKRKVASGREKWKVEGGRGKGEGGSGKVEWRAEDGRRSVVLLSDPPLTFPIVNASHRVGISYCLLLTYLLLSCQIMSNHVETVTNCTGARNIMSKSLVDA